MVLLILLPIFIMICVLYLYRFSGRKEFLRFDLVQFIFAFFVYPVAYIWMKQFLYILLREEIGVLFSIGQWITIDTIFTIFFLYFYAFGIIHSLTKSFNLKVNRDPFFDVFEQSEYFHQFITHVGMYVAGFILFVIFGVINSFFPFDIVIQKNPFYTILGSAIAAGMLCYIGAFISTDKGMGYQKYKRIMKLTFGMSFAILAITYFVQKPAFNLQFAMYWFAITLFTTLIASMFIFNPTRKFGKLLRTLPLQGTD